MTAGGVEAEARRYLRLFPGWMRAQRGEEAVGLVLDQLPSDATRLPLRARADLVRAGLHARRVGRPPGKVRRSVANATASWTGGTVPPEWRPWLLDGLPHRSFAVRMALSRTWPTWIFLAVVLTSSAGDRRHPLLWAALVVLPFIALDVGSALVRADRWRATVSLRNGLRPDGEPLTAADAADHWTGPAVRNVWMLPTLLATTVALVAVGATGWAAFDSNGSGALVYWLVIGAGVVGWFLAVDAMVRRRLDPEHAPLPAAADPPRRGWSVDVLLAAAVGVVVGVAVSVAASGVLELLGLGVIVRWVLAATVGLAAVRVARAERAPGRPIGLWDLVPTTGPRFVRGASVLPPPPDLPPPPALG